MRFKNHNKTKKMRIFLIPLSTLTIYSLISLSINSWFHNVAMIYKGTDSTNLNMRLYSHVFQGSFAFDILLFVWSLFGHVLARKPVKFMCLQFSFFLVLLCIGKLITTCIFLANDDIKKINEEYELLYNKNSLENETKSWKASYENMYVSVILEWILSGLFIVLLNIYTSSTKIQRTI